MHTGSPREHMANTWEHVSNSCCWSHNPLMVEECNLRIIHNPPHIICICESLLISHHCWDSAADDSAPVILSVYVYSVACVHLDQPALPCSLCDYLHTCVCLCTVCYCLFGESHSAVSIHLIRHWHLGDCFLSAYKMSACVRFIMTLPCRLFIPMNPGLAAVVTAHAHVFEVEMEVLGRCVYSCQLTDSMTWNSICFYVVRWVNLG